MVILALGWMKTKRPVEIDSHHMVTSSPL